MWVLSEVVNLVSLAIFASWIILDLQFAAELCCHFLSFAFPKYLNACLQNAKDIMYR